MNLFNSLYPLGFTHDAIHLLKMAFPIVSIGLIKFMNITTVLIFFK